MIRRITYRESINEALFSEMKIDPTIFVYGIGVPDHKKIFGSVKGLEVFGPERFFDVPLSESALMGLGVGAAINGLKPVYIHMRVDFLLLAMNQLINMASTVHYCSGGKLNVPIVIRAVIGRGWGQGCQHSKTLQSIFSHIPGIKVVLPVTPYESKGMLISAIRDPNPVIVLEHRWLYDTNGEVPEESYTVSLEKPRLMRSGNDITIVATSWMNVEAIHAASILEKHNVSVEIINACIASEFDDSLIIDSVKKTGRCIIIDDDWVHCGFSAELSSRINEKAFYCLKSPVHRIGFTHTPCPCARNLENKFYPNAASIIKAFEKIFNRSPIDLSGEVFSSYENKFLGPF